MKMSLVHNRKIWLLLSIVSLFLVTPLPTFAFEETFASIIFAITIGIGGIVAWLGGLVLDFAIAQVVIGFSSALLGSVGVMINELWQVIRDVFNILFIFSLIYIGFCIILRISDSSWRRQLGLLIVAALLINFSLFFTKLVVDFANLAAYQIYSQIIVNDRIGGGVVDIDFDTEDPRPKTSRAETTISGAFMDSMRLTTFADTEVITAGAKGDFFSIVARVAVFGLGMMIFMIMAGVTFFAGGFLLIARFVTLVLLMIFSPLLFAGWIFPGFKSLTSKWIKMFIGNAFVAPAYLFMLLLSLNVINAFASTIGTDAKFSNVFKDGSEVAATSTGSLVLFFFVAIGFLWASVAVAKQMGAAGAATSMKMFDAARGAMQGFAYRNSAGLGLEGTRRLWDGVNRTRVGRAATGLLGGESTRRSLIKARDYDAGGTGYTQIRDDSKAVAQRNRLSGSSSNLTGSIRTGTSSTATDPEKIAMERAIAQASSSELIEMTKTKAGRNALLSVADKLPESKLKAIMDDKDTVSGDFKAALGAKRGDSTKASLGISTTGATPNVSGIKDATKEQLTSLDVETLKQGAAYLQDSQIDDLKKRVTDGNLTQTEFQQIKDKRKDDINSFASTPTRALHMVNSRNSAKEVAKLPNAFLEDENFIRAITNPNANHKLSVSLLNKIASESDANKGAIGTNINSVAGISAGDGSAVGDWMSSGVGLNFRT